MNKSEAKDEAIRRAGGAAVVSAEIGITIQAVCAWPHVPAKHCLAVERLSGMSRYLLRPDIYGEPPPGPLDHLAA